MSVPAPPTAGFLPKWAGGPGNEISNEPLMCSHANAKEKERALSQFTPCLPGSVGICWWGRAEGVGRGAESGPRIEVVALEGSQGLT